MGIRRAAVITCDKTDCTDAYVGCGRPDVETARADAWGSGWQTRKIGRALYDFCPDHIGETP